MIELDDVFQVVCRFLNDSDVDYALVGGVAVMHHGFPRTTIGVDPIIRLRSAEMNHFVDFLRSQGSIAILLWSE